MNGWKYEWVGELPDDVYDVLLEMVKEEEDKQP
jgi:hypothetical protein